MKHFFHLLLLSFSALCVIGCADLDDEIGYNGVVSTPLQAEITDVTPNGSYIVRMYAKVDITHGKADISNCKMVINGSSYDCLSEPDGTIVCTVAGFNFGESYYYSLYATINGMEKKLAENSFYYNKRDTWPQVSNVILEMRTPGVLTVCADYATMNRFELTSAVAKIGTERYDMTYENGKAELSIDMGELPASSYQVSVTLENKAGSATQAAEETFSFAESVTEYDNSQDKFLDDCIYMCGTYWAKGQVASSNHNSFCFEPDRYKFYLDSSFFWGMQKMLDMPSYFKTCADSDEEKLVNLQGTEHDLVTQMLGKQWGTPTSDQFRKLYENTSFQPVEVYNGSERVGLGYIFYTRNDKKRIVSSSILRCEASNVYKFGVYLPMEWKIYGYYSTSDYSYKKSGVYASINNLALRIDDNVNGEPIFFAIGNYLSTGIFASYFSNQEVTLIPVKLVD